MINFQLENEGTHNFNLILNNFLQRVKTEIDDFCLALKNFYDDGVTQVKDLTKSKSFKEALLMFIILYFIFFICFSRLNKFGDNTSYEIFYNMKKILLVDKFIYF